MRKSRGKREVETYNNNNNNNEGTMENCYGENNVLEFPCKKHPTSSATTGGICAYCLTDRLYQLVCPQCGEQRYSSNCSCTDHLYSSSFNPNSSSTTDVGHRISFLLENDNKPVHPNNNNNNNYYNGGDVSSSRPRLSEHRVSTSSNVDDYATLRRSNSTCVGDLSYNNYHNNNNSSNYNMNMNSTNIGRKESKEKFWKIGRLFRKKKDKSNNNNNNNYNYNNTNNNNNNYNINNNDQENNNNECNGVTRSRSLCSFRGFYDTEESGNVPISSSAARASSVSTGNFYVDSAKQSCFSESEARISNFDTYFDPNGFNKMSANNNTSNNNNIFSLKETEFTTCDDPAYIDLKLHDDVSSSRVPDLGALRRNGRGMSSTKEFSFRGRNDDDDVMGSEMFRNGSCRRSSVTERELRKCRKSSKVLRWFFKHQQQSNPGDSYQDDHPHGFN